MASYELTLSPNYVPLWGAKEALRELFQNGIDRETETDGKSAFSSCYDIIKRRLVLANQDTYLSPRSLLLGETTKIDGKSIGKYGEGYKLALLVMLRLGMRPVIENNNEIWTPRIKKSRKYGCDILVIETQRNKHSDGHLRYIINQVSPEQWTEFQANCLRFHTLEVTPTTPGDILYGENWKGKVFCSGLFVCEIPEFHYGYNMKPKFIELNRDRNKVNTFNMSWETSRMWAELRDLSHSTAIHDMLQEKAIDIEYYRTHVMENSEIYKAVCDMEYTEFLKTHGTNAVVCRDKEEADVIRYKYGNLVPVIVPETQYAYIAGSPSYKATHYGVKNTWTPSNFVSKWLDGPQNKETLINEARKWQYQPGKIANIPQESGFEESDSSNNESGSSGAWQI